MAVVEQLLRAEKDGSISFGNYELPEKKRKRILSITGICSKLRLSRISRSLSAMKTLYTSQFRELRLLDLRRLTKAWSFQLRAKVMPR